MENTSNSSVVLKTIYCKGVRSFTLFQKPSLFAVVTLVAGDRRISARRTLVDRSGAENPEWDDTIQFDLDRTGSDRDLLSLEFEIRDECHLPIISDKLAGRAFVPFADLAADGPAGTASYQIQAPDGKPNGVLTFSYRIAAPDAGIPFSSPPEAIGSFYPPSAPPEPAAYYPPPEEAYACSSGFNPPVFDQPPTSAAAYPPPATSYPPPATSYAPPATSYAPLATSYPPPATSYPPPATCYAPPATSYPPPATYYPLPATSYPPPATSYPPPGTYQPPPAPSLGYFSTPSPANMYPSPAPPAGEFYQPACYHPPPPGPGRYRGDGWDRGLYGCY